MTMTMNQEKIFPNEKKNLTGTAVIDETLTDPVRLKRNIVKL